MDVELRRLDPVLDAVPSTCLWCRWGYPIMFGDDDPTDTWACGAHTVWGLRSSKLTAPRIDRRYELGRAYAPLMMWDETCDRFSVLERGSRKWDYLAGNGILEKVSGDE